MGPVRVPPKEGDEAGQLVGAWGAVLRPPRVSREPDRLHRVRDPCCLPLAFRCRRPGWPCGQHAEVPAREHAAGLEKRAAHSSVRHPHAWGAQGPRGLRAVPGPSGGCSFSTSSRQAPHTAPVPHSVGTGRLPTTHTPFRGSSLPSLLCKKLQAPSPQRGVPV